MSDFIRDESLALIQYGLTAETGEAREPFCITQKEEDGMLIDMDIAEYAMSYDAIAESAASRQEEQQKQYDALITFISDWSGL